MLAEDELVTSLKAEYAVVHPICFCVDLTESGQLHGEPLMLQRGQNASESHLSIPPPHTERVSFSFSYLTIVTLSKLVIEIFYDPTRYYTLFLICGTLFHGLGRNYFHCLGTGSKHLFRVHCFLQFMFDVTFFLMSS